MIGRLCLHCGRASRSRPRGLCWTCYNKPDIRDQYPRQRPIYSQDDFNGPAPLPAQPTDAVPGTEEKMDVLQGRAERKELLFHPGDARASVT